MSERYLKDQAEADAKAMYGEKPPGEQDAVEVGDAVRTAAESKLKGSGPMTPSATTT